MSVSVAQIYIDQRIKNWGLNGYKNTDDQQLLLLKSVFSL